MLSYPYTSDILLVSSLNDDWRLDLFREQLGECRERLAREGSSMLLTAVTLIFALIGCSNRMRFKSDFPVQKALGMITDLVGFATLLKTITELGILCDVDADRVNATDIVEMEVFVGTGYVCYVVCLLGAFFRALFHWVSKMCHFSLFTA